MKSLCINILGLDVGTHSFSFSLGVDFLQLYSGGSAPEGTFNAIVELSKREMFIEANFCIKGKMQLTCDRSLRTFDHPMNMKKKVIFKYGTEHKKFSVDAVFIDQNAPTLEVGQLMYDWISLAVPMQKWHPDFRYEHPSNIDGEVVYSTSSTNLEDNKEVNPIWEKLVSQHKN